VRLIGLGLSGWPAPDPGVQRDLFDTADTPPQPEEPTLTETLDAIRYRFGREAIQRGLGSHRPLE
jgi:hypothetical protein